MEVSKEELAKRMMVGTELAKEIQEIKRAWDPRTNKDKDKDTDKEKKGKSRWRRKEGAANEVTAEEEPVTTDAP